MDPIMHCSWVGAWVGGQAALTGAVLFATTIKHVMPAEHVFYWRNTTIGLCHKGDIPELRLQF